MIETTGSRFVLESTVMNLIANLKWFLQGTTPGAQRARQWSKILFLLALFMGLFWVVPFEQVIAAILKADVRFFLIGLLFSFVSTLLNAAELIPLLRKQAIQHRIDQVLVINLAVKFYSLFMPSSIVGSGLRWYRLSQPNGKTAEALAAMAFFRMLETFLNISMGVSFLVLSGQDVGQTNSAWFWLAIIGIVLLWFAVTRWSLPVYGWFKARWGRLWERPALKWLLRALEKFLRAVAGYSDMPSGGLALAILAGVISLLPGAVSNLFVARSIGIDLPFLTIGWIYAVVILAAQLPFAFAGGLGVREITLVAVMPLVGVNAELALAFSFLLFVRGVIISLVGGILEAIRIFLKRRGAKAGDPVDQADVQKLAATDAAAVSDTAAVKGAAREI